MTHSSAWPLTIVFTGFIAVGYGFGIYLFPAISPLMRPELSLQLSALGDIASAQQLGFLAGSALVGRAVTTFGPRRIILVAMAASTLCLFGMAAIQSIWSLAALLIILNSAAVFAWAPMVSVVAHYVPYRHRGKALGFISSGTSYGVLINGLLLAPLADQAGWRPTWVAAATIAAGLLAASLIVMRGLVRLPRQAQAADTYKDKDAVHALAAGGWPIVAIAVLGGMAGWPFLTYWSAFLQGELHHSAALSSRTWSLVGLVGLIAGVSAGFLADRIGPRAALAVTACLLGLAGGLTALRPTSLTLFLAAACFGSSFNPTYGLLAATISKTSLAHHATALSALVNAGLGVGTLIGEFLAALSDSTFGSLRPIYVSTTVLAIAMLGLVIFALPNQQSTSASLAAALRYAACTGRCKSHISTSAWYLRSCWTSSAVATSGS